MTQNESSYLKYWDVNNSYDRAMLQKLPVNKFEQIKDTSQFNEDFIKKTVIKKRMKDIFSKLMFNILKNYLNFTMIYHFYRKKMKIEKVEQLVTNLHDKTEYVIHIRNLKLALNHGLIQKKVPGAIKFNQKAWLKPYIYINTNLRQKAKIILRKIFLS